MTDKTIACLVFPELEATIDVASLPAPTGVRHVPYEDGFLGTVIGIARLREDGTAPETEQPVRGWVLLTDGEGQVPRLPSIPSQLVSLGAPQKVIGLAVAAVAERARIQRLLEEREAFIQRMLDELPDGVATVDAAGRFIAWNRAVSAMTGLRREDVIGRTADELGLLNTQASVRALEELDRMRRGDPGVPFETALQHVKGHHTPVEITARVMREGGSLRVQLIVRNISARKESEQALRESEERFRRLSEAAFEGIMLHQDGIILDANRQAFELFGYSGDEVIGRHVDDFICESNVERIVESAEEDSGSGERRLEVWAIHRDGSRRLLDVVSRPFPWKGQEARVVTMRDISRERENEELLRLAKVIIERTPSLVFRWGNEPGSPVLFASPSVRELGHDPGELVRERTCFTELIHPEDLSRARHLVDQELRDGRDHYQVEYRLRGRDGSVRWYEDLTILERHADGSTGDRMGILIDVTARKEAEETIRQMAYFDQLTGLPNRVFLREHASDVMQRNVARQRRVALLLLDVDRFKVINDSLGHEAGDELLLAIGERLNQQFARTGVVTRLGGDEFGVLLPDIEGVPDAERAARQVLEAFQTPFQLRGGETFATTSVGVSLHPDHGDDWDALSHFAEVAMYAAKDEGRNTFQIYAQDMQRIGLDRLELENALRRAVERDELFLLYQPQLDLKTGEIVGVEALVRWSHPEHGVLSPMTFIPLAEETGLIREVGRWVLETGCAQMKAWHDAGLSGLKLAVNLSARQFQSREIVDEVRDVLERTGMNPERLELELTESTIMTDSDRAVLLLEDLKAMGCRISIDDFGTGYSSLSHLKRFPIDTLKIDQTFVRDISEGPDDAAIASAVITLSHALNLGVVAEGVENIQQRDFLLGQECGTMQGFLFSRPLDSLALETFVRTHKAAQAG